ncbi:MAG: spore cortex biosynthesis protein YabQ [Halanaerobiaceae bacterium]
MDFLFNQLKTFFVMLTFGIIAGAVFNFYQYILHSLKLKKIWINLMDIIISLVMGITGFGFLLLVNRGEMRFYVLLAILLGFSLYYILRKVFRLFIF